MKPCSIAMILAALLFGVAAASQAQEPPDLTSLSPEALAKVQTRAESSASKYLQKIVDAPASVSVITADEIHRYGYRTLGDVLNSVRGISISNDRNYTYLGFRGLSRPGDLNTRVLILIDGHRLNDNVFDSAFIGNEFPVDLESVDRVEIIRGPGAAFYGTSAFSVVISIITKRGDRPDGLETTGSLGAFDTRRVRTEFGTTTSRGVHLFMSGSAAASAGTSRLYFPEFDAHDTNNGIADDVDGEQTERVAMNLDAGHFSLQGIYGNRLKHVPTASFGTLFNDARTRTIDKRGYVDAQYGREVGQRTDLVARGYWDYYRYDGWYPFGTDGDSIINRDTAYGSWGGGEFNVSHRLTTRHRLTAGAELRHSLRQDQLNYDEPPSSLVFLDDHRHLTTWATNLQDEFVVNSRLQMNAALRYESVPTGPAQVTPKIGVILDLRATTTLKLLFSRALRSPSVYERFYESPPNYVSNPLLDPEKIETVEIAFEHAISPKAHISGSIFANRLTGLIISSADDNGLIRFVNGLNTRAQGVEIAWSSRSDAGLDVGASYSDLWDRNAQAGTWLGGAPKRLAKFNVGVPVERLHMTAALSVQAEGLRSTHTGDVLPAVAVSNVNLLWAVKKNLEIQGSIFNLFNAQYGEPASTDHVQGAIPQPARQIEMKLLWRIH